MAADVLSIGDFSRMTQLSVKTLRHYHDVGLVEPHHVDPSTGYRYYSHDQVRTAQVVRRLRGLDMPIPDVRSVLAADPDDRNAMISAHLGRLEAKLAETRSAVKALRDILDRPTATTALEHRSVPAVPSIAVHADVEREDLLAWWQGAITELRDAVHDQSLAVTGPPCGMFGFDVFARDRGPATMFIPVAGDVEEVGRTREFIAPAAELVVVRHRGPHDDVDLAYSALGEYATRHEISVDGALREYYPRFSWDTDDPSQWETDLCWPIFRSDRGGAV
jgi:DNA-binding transcriptional MerR regulator/effector-binding domain-containing protein